MTKIDSRLILYAVFALVVLAFISPLYAAGKLDIVRKFTKGNTELKVATFTENAERVGLIGIASPARNSFAFKLKEWQMLIGLCTKASKIKSATWTEVGSMSETGTVDVSHLTVSAGPGMNFVITSPKKGTVSYAIQTPDYPVLLAALQKVKAYLSP